MLTRITWAIISLNTRGKRAQVLHLGEDRNYMDNSNVTWAQMASNTRALQTSDSTPL